MNKLNKSVRIRLSEDDLLLFKELKRLKKKPTTFLRLAFREKIERELPKLIENETKLKSKAYTPF